MTWPQVFINYRGADTASAATLLHKFLSDEFGSESVFLDYRSIPLGRDFVPELLDAVRNCSALLVVIGPDWLATGESGRRLIDDPDDWVGREIRTALRSNVVVIPVLLGETPRLRAGELPEDLAILARLQCARVRHRHQPQDIQHLIEELVAEFPGLRRARRSPSGAGGRGPTVDARGSTGIQVGDHNEMHIGH